MKRSLVVSIVCLVALLHSTCLADLTFYSSDTDFQLATTGLTSLGTEGFEQVDSNVLPYNTTGAAIDDPLTQTTSNPVYPNGIDLPITVQSNTLGANPTSPSPQGTNGLTVQRLATRYSGDYVYRLNSTMLFPNSGSASIDYIFESSDKIRAVSMFPRALHPLDVTVDIRVYDVNNNFLGSTSVLTNIGNVSANGIDYSLNPFLGIVSSTADIGRINLNGYITPGDSTVSGADDITLLSAVPEPTCSWLALGCLAHFVCRRRRR